MTITEEELVEIVDGAAKGEAASTAKLYQVMRRKFAYGTLQRLRHDGWEDVFHDAFIVVLEAVTGGKIDKKESVLGYMRTVLERTEAAKITCLMRDRTTMDSDLIDHAYQQRDSVVSLALRAKESPYRDYVKAEKIAIMCDELATLRPRDQEILRRYYLDGEKIPAIIKAMNLTKNQFRLNKCRAKKKLQAAVAFRLSIPERRRDLLDRPAAPVKASLRSFQKEQKAALPQLKAKTRKEQMVGKRVVNVTNNDGEVTLHFSDGTSARVFQPDVMVKAA